MPTLTPDLGLWLAAAGADHTVASVLLSILGIGFLIFVHELGHFLACRMTGTRVETFAIGLGPRLFGWERDASGARRFTVGRRQTDPTSGAMDVRVAAIPLGGYVKMAGEIGGDGSPASGAGARRPPRPDEFPAKPVRHRVFIISAGVLMNIFAAFVLYFVAYGAGLLDTPAVVGEVAPGGPAWRAGLRPGDRVLSVDGSTVRSFTDFQTEILHGGSGSEMSVVVERDGKPATVRLKPEYDPAAGMRRALLSSGAAWRVDDGRSPAFVIGATERVLVEGRPCRGGAAAAVAASEAADLGLLSVRVERAGEPPRTVDLSPLRRWSDGGPFRLGVAPASRLTVAQVRPGGRAEAADLRAGDRIEAADGQPVDQPARLGFLPSIRALTVERGGRLDQVVVGASDPEAVAGFLADFAFDARSTEGPALAVPTGVEFQDGKSPAGEAGLLPGDRIVSVNGKPVATWAELLAAGATLAPVSVRLEVQTGDAPPRELSVLPRAVRDPAARQRFFPLEAPREPIRTEGLLDAAGLAAARTAGEVRNVFRVIGGFFGGGISFEKNVGGPFTIATVSSATVSQHWTRFLAFLAFISVNLAVLNILPIPVLDGGHLLFLLVEKLRRGRPLKEATIARFQMVGFALLMILMVFALKNDFATLFLR